MRPSMDKMDYSHDMDDEEDDDDDDPEIDPGQEDCPEICHELDQNVCRRLFQIHVLWNRRDFSFWFSESTKIL